MIALTKLLLAVDPLHLMMALTGAGLSAMLALVGVSCVIDAVKKQTCPRCKRWAQIEGDDPWT